MSQESEQAQEADRKFMEDEIFYKKAYADGQNELKAALKAEIEKEMEDILKTQIGSEAYLTDREIKAVTAGVLSLLDTVIPIKNG